MTHEGVWNEICTILLEPTLDGRLSTPQHNLYLDILSSDITSYDKVLHKTKVMSYDNTYDVI